MTTAGFISYPTEWWHYSYGDRYWARATKHPLALYRHTTEPTRDADGRGYASRAAPVREDR